jgi:branched-chain amino acid transport system permease protein
MNFLTYLISGISLGSVYAIIALGYTMVYGIAKMLNFAHGDFIMVGCYAIFTIVGAFSGSGLGMVIGVIAATVICTAVGVLTERIAYRPLREAGSPLAVLITAIGVSYLLENLALLIF